VRRRRRKKREKRCLWCEWWTKEVMQLGLKLQSQLDLQKPPLIHHERKSAMSSAKKGLMIAVA